MNATNDITDEEFVPFLRSLGVETYNKSFEWILNDTEFAPVMTWIYENLDQNNALSAREEYRYAEIEKKGNLLSPVDLESTLSSIQVEFPNIALPGDMDAIEDVKKNIHMQKERLHSLEMQGTCLENLVKKNDLAKQELNREVTNLNATHQQCSEDEHTSSEECLLLAEELETITGGIMEVIGNTFDLYGNYHVDREIAKQFLIFGPFDSYKQRQSLFHSHVDLYTSKKLLNRQHESVSDEDVRTVLIHAKNREERLSDALCEYIDSIAELNSDQAKLALVANYNNVHPSQVTNCMLEAQSAVDFLKQEEEILDQEIQNAIRQLVDSRTGLAVETTALSALVVREQIHQDLTYLLEVTKEAFALDRVLYLALRHSLRTVEEFAQFAAEMRRHCIMESDAVRNRIETMNEICSEQAACEEKLRSINSILRTLYTVMGVQYDTDATRVVKCYNDVLARVRELRSDIEEGYRRKGQNILQSKQLSKPLLEYIFDGCTKQPNCHDLRVASLSHSLLQELERVDKKAVDASVFYTRVKNGDKNGLRKLWQWFLTDPAQLIVALRSVHNH